MLKKIFSLVLFLSLVSAPTVSHAGFFDMFKLKTNLQAAIASKNSATDLKGFEGYKQGDKGGSIAEAQERLLKLGYYNQAEPSGYFDLDTEIAVMKFQKDNSIEANGKLNRETLSILLSSDDRGGNVFTIQVKALLGGAYNNTTGMMNSTLNDTGLIPLAEPYTNLGYGFIGGGGEETTASVFNVTGNNAIVDWVVLELRDPTDIYNILYSRAALIQADGDIVDVDGVSPVSVETNFSEYYVAIMHRNHIGIISSHWYGTSEVVDMTSEPLYGGADAAKLVAANKRVMWPGDVNQDGQVKYTGSGNDRDEILVVVGSTTPNTIISGYLPSDVNLDGQVKYTGTSNDRDILLQNVGSNTPNNIISSQLPELSCFMSEFVSNNSQINNLGIEFTITFDVTALSGGNDCNNIAISSSTENNNGVDVNGQGVTYTVGTSIQTPTVNGVIMCMTNCDPVAGGYRVTGGDTSRFRLIVLAQSLAHGEFYDLAMHSINWRNGNVATNADKFYRANLGYTSVYRTQPILYP